MSVSERTRRALKDFGLTEYEVKAYIALVESGPMPASQLSTTAMIPYSKIYEILGNLERKGWVETEQGRPSKYFPKPPATALESSRVRTERIRETLGRTRRELLVAMPIVPEAVISVAAPLLTLMTSRGIKVSVMVPAGTNREAMRKLKGLVEIRTREQMFGGGLISDSNEIIILLGEEPEKGLTLAISSEHVGLVKFGKSYFEFLWENSSPG